MGNCLRHKSSTTYAREDSGSPAAERPFKNSTTQNDRSYDNEQRTVLETEEEKILEEKKSVSSFTEVKIKITKKQLKELLGRPDVQGLSVEHILAQLLNASDEYKIQQQSWRPTLQSILE